MTRITTGAVLAAISLLTGCQEQYLSVDDSGRKTAAPPSALTSVPAVQGRGVTGLSGAAAAAAGDTCGAASLTYLIGKPKQQIPVSVDLTRRRVVCATCDRPPDVDPRRATILFDASSGLVVAVRCE